MTIDWQEWRDHFLLHSLENVEDVLYFWKHSTVSQGPPAREPEGLCQDSTSVLSIWGSVNEALYLCTWGLRSLWTPQISALLSSQSTLGLLRLQGQLVGTGVTGEKIHQMVFAHLTHVAASCCVLAAYSTAPGAEGRCRQTLYSEGPEESTGNGEGGQLLHRGENH